MSCSFLMPSLFALDRIETINGFPTDAGRRRYAAEGHSRGVLGEPRHRDYWSGIRVSDAGIPGMHSMSMHKILVVDDEPRMRRVLQAGLVVHGYEVDEAESGEEALTKVEAEHYDVVLLDLNLPGIDGIETCRGIRSASEVPVIIVSIRVSQKDKLAARVAGANDYITKPFGLDELLKRILVVSNIRPCRDE
jgi:CheY-like chemotaxis protein